MIVRQIGAGEIAPAIQLIWDTFLQFEAPDYSNEGVRAFRSFIENREIVASLEFFGAYENGQLRGVLATNAHRRHICCFFVDALFHRQGIGRKLWEFLLANSVHGEFTVHSSPYAVPVYHKLGFVDMDVEQIADGIRFTPMRYLRGHMPSDA